MTSVDSVIELLGEIREEESLSKQVDDRIQVMMDTLGEPIDISLRVDRVRSIIESLDEDPQLPAFVRTQLWNVSAALELL